VASHYEGRSWRCFHPHATLCIAASGFLLRQRLKDSGTKQKSPLNQKLLACPRITRRAAAGRIQRHEPDSIATLRYLLARGITKKSWTDGPAARC
jgi:hypothetical protein